MEGLPPVARSLVESGEALAYLHLSGNAVNDETDKAELLYEVKVKERTAAFRYKVVCTCSELTGTLGKAVAYQPLHDPDRIVVAFRAVRVVDMKNAKVSGNRSDVECMLDTKFAKTGWLPSKGASISLGVARHAGSIWGTNQWGLSSFLKSCNAREVHFTGLSLAGALAQVVALKAAYERISTPGGALQCPHVFTFGAVPWANGAAAADYASVLGEQSVHLCSHATLQAGHMCALPPWWVNAGPCEVPSSVPLCSEADTDASGGRGLYNFEVTDPISCASHSEHAMLCSTFAIESLKGPIALDPEHYGVLKGDHGLWPGDHDLWADGAVLHRLTRFPPSLVSRRNLLSLFAHELADDHPLTKDYMMLHRGRAYKAAVRGLVHAAMEAVDSAAKGVDGAAERLDSQDAVQGAVEGVQSRDEAPIPRDTPRYTEIPRDTPRYMTSGTAPPEAAPSNAPSNAPSSSSSKMMRSSSSKRSLGASDTRGVEAGPEQPTQQDGGMTKRPSYGSLVNSLQLTDACGDDLQLDEITMF